MYAAEWPCCHDPLRFSLGSDDLLPRVTTHRQSHQSRVSMQVQWAAPQRSQRTCNGRPLDADRLRPARCIGAAPQNTWCRGTQCIGQPLKLPAEFPRRISEDGERNVSTSTSADLEGAPALQTLSAWSLPIYGQVSVRSLPKGRRRRSRHRRADGRRGCSATRDRRGDAPLPADRTDTLQASSVGCPSRLIRAHARRSRATHAPSRTLQDATSLRWHAYGPAPLSFRDTPSCPEQRTRGGAPSLSDRNVRPPRTRCRRGRRRCGGRTGKSHVQLS